jgi:hypothetical protein
VHRLLLLYYIIVRAPAPGAHRLVGVDASQTAAINAAVDKAEDDASFLWRSKSFLQQAVPVVDPPSPSRSSVSRFFNNLVSGRTGTGRVDPSQSFSVSTRAGARLPHTLSDATVVAKRELPVSKVSTPVLTFDLKIIVSFFQVATSLAAVLEIPWPSQFVNFINIFNIVRLMSLLEIQFIHCWLALICNIGQYGFHSVAITNVCEPSQCPSLSGLIVLVCCFK